MKKRVLFLGLAATLMLSLCCGVVGAVELRSSPTLLTYSASAARGDNTGEIKIKYDVKANDVADKVGISSIEIYKSNGAYVTTITGTTSNGLIRTGGIQHKSTYVYHGTSGTSYYAIVTVYAKIGSLSDSDTVTTGTATAP